MRSRWRAMTSIQRDGALRVGSSWRKALALLTPGCHGFSLGGGVSPRGRPLGLDNSRNSLRLAIPNTAWSAGRGGGALSRAAVSRSRPGVGDPFRASHSCLTSTERYQRAR